MVANPSILIISVLWFFLILIWDISSDYRKWLNRKTIKHSKEAVIRAVLLIPTFIGLSFASPLYWPLSMFIVGFLMFFTWWLLFDGIYNSLRGFGWWFNGSIDSPKKDSKLDLFLMKLSDTQEACIKIIPLIIFLLLYCLSFFNKFINIKHSP